MMSSNEGEQEDDESDEEKKKSAAALPAASPDNRGQSAVFSQQYQLPVNRPFFITLESHDRPFIDEQCCCFSPQLSEKSATRHDGLEYRNRRKVLQKCQSLPVLSICRVSVLPEDLEGIDSELSAMVLADVLKAGQPVRGSDNDQKTIKWAIFQHKRN